MERIVIPGKATYTPVALTDVIMGTSALRLVLGATVPGMVLQSVALGYYAGSAARDWAARWKVRPVDFRAEFDADVDKLDPMPEAERQREVEELARALNADYTPARPTRAVMAKKVNERLTAYIAAITDQEVVTSSEVRDFSLAKVMFPFALGTCDMISGDVALFRDTGVFEPHVIAHEFCHRKGYFKELHAQALSYLALRTSGDPVMIQAARAERLHRQLKILCGDDPSRFDAIVGDLWLRPELRAGISALKPAPASGYADAVGSVMKPLYEKRMQLTGQNGLSDYDEGFTNFLWTFSRSATARRPREHAAV
ncbi:MAG: hypothetical protein ABMA64_42310 [Myxococcota bacterium]